MIAAHVTFHSTERTLPIHHDSHVHGGVDATQAIDALDDALGSRRDGATPGLRADESRHAE